MYDVKSGELARSFLSDYRHKPKHQEELAQAIQDAIDEWFASVELPLLDEEHTHTCQQCDKIVGETCHCERGDTYMTWCSPRCRAAYDL